MYCKHILFEVALAGCGITTAARIAQTSLAPALFEATRDLSTVALSNFLKGWCQQLWSELAYNKQNMLKHAYPAIASRITNDFPSVDTLQLYVHPCTSWTQGSSHQISRERWVSCSLKLPALGALCERFFAWEAPHQILDCFGQSIWSGVCSRYLMQVSNNLNSCLQNLNVRTAY